MEFENFTKIARLSREVVVTEKLDGTNAQIAIGENGEFFTGSRNKWITPEDDNYGFSRWAHANREDLMKLGPGRHYGEWFGSGIQRGYGLTEKRFALFNTHRWSDPSVRPSCCDCVPDIVTAVFTDLDFDRIMANLASNGSYMVPGFMRPEGIVIYHTAANLYFKKTILKDELPKGISGA